LPSFNLSYLFHSHEFLLFAGQVSTMPQILSCVEIRMNLLKISREISPRVPFLRTLDSYYLRPSICWVICESRTICRDNVAYINNMSLCAKHSAWRGSLVRAAVFTCLRRTRYIKASCAQLCACIRSCVRACVYVYPRLRLDTRARNKQSATTTPSRWS